MAGTKSEKCFVRKHEMYTLAEKKEPEELVNRYNKKYDKELKDLEGKTTMITNEKSTQIYRF